MTEPARPTRRIELEIEVPGAPEEVWAAVATGPGISSWFIPMDIEERAGGKVTMRWGPTFGDTTAEVKVWEPPHRVVFGGGDEPALAYEWLVEARDGGSCVVRLVNSGFGEGDEWDEQFHGMSEGWKIFLENLRLQRSHFGGRSVARTIIPTVSMAGPGRAAWERLCRALGLPTDAAAGDLLRTGEGAPPLTGRVDAVLRGPAARAYLLVLDEPHRGTGFVAVEGDGDTVAASLYLYLYDEAGHPVGASVEQQWRSWLEAHVASSDAPAAT